MYVSCVLKSSVVTSVQGLITQNDAGVGDVKLMSKVKKTIVEGPVSI